MNHFQYYPVATAPTQLHYQPQEHHQRQPQPQYPGPKPGYHAMGQYPPQHQAVPMVPHFEARGYANFNLQPQLPLGFPGMPSPIYQMHAPGPTFHRPPPPPMPYRQWQQQPQQHPPPPRQRPLPTPPLSADQVPVRSTTSRPQGPILDDPLVRIPESVSTFQQTPVVGASNPPAPTLTPFDREVLYADLEQFNVGVESFFATSQEASTAGAQPDTADPADSTLPSVPATRGSPSARPEPIVIDLITDDDNGAQSAPSINSVAESSLPRGATPPPPPPASHPKDAAPAAEDPLTRVLPLGVKRTYAWLDQAAPGAEMPNAKRTRWSNQEGAFRADYDQRQANATAALFLGVKATRPAPPPVPPTMNFGASSSSGTAVASSSSGSGGDELPRKKGRKGKGKGKGKERAKSPEAGEQEKGKGKERAKSPDASEQEKGEGRVAEDDDSDDDLPGQIEAMFESEEVEEEEEEVDDDLPAQIEAMFEKEEVEEEEEEVDDDLPAQIEAMFEDEVEEEPGNGEGRVEDEDEVDESDWAELEVIENPVPGQNH